MTDDSVHKRPAPNRAAITLLGHAERRSSGYWQLGDRTLRLVAGACVAIAPGHDDTPAHAFLASTGQLDREALEEARTAAAGSEAKLVQHLASANSAQRERLRSQLRSLYVQRLATALGSAMDGRPTPAAPPPGGPGPVVVRYALLSLTLDALRAAVAEQDEPLLADAASHRLQWLPGAFTDEARQWAQLQAWSGEPLVGSLLEAMPSSAGAISALVRAQLARLQPPPSTGSGGAVASVRSRAETLPPAAPRLSLQQRLSSVPAYDPAPGKLDPGQVAVEVEPVPPLAPLPLPAVENELQDPVRQLELRIDRLEARDATASERGACWMELAVLWDGRLGSRFEATRALREATAADPTRPGLIARTARACLAGGELELALSYAQAWRAQVASEDPRADSPHSLEAVRLGVEIACLGGESREALAQLSALEAPTTDDLRMRWSIETHLGEEDAAARTAATLAAALADPRKRLRYARLALAAPGASPGTDATRAERVIQAARLPHPWASAMCSIAALRARQDPASATRLWRLAAEAAQRAGDHETAVGAWTHAHETTPLDSDIWTPWTACLGRAGQAEAQLVALQGAAALATGDRARWLSLAAEAARALDGREDFARLFERAAAASPPETRQMCEALAAGMGRRAEAALDEQEQAELYVRAAGLHLMGGRLQDTASAAQACLARAPAHGLARAYLQYASGRLGMLPAAVEGTERAVRNTDDETQRARLLTRLALLCARHDRPQDAVEHAEAALVCDPGHSEAAILLVELVDSIDKQRLETVLGQATKALPDDVVLTRHLAQLPANADTVPRALTALRRLRQLLPEAPATTRAILELACQHEDAKLLAAEAPQALSAIALPEDADTVRQAASALADLGELGSAARILVALQDRLPPRDDNEAARALEFAQLAADEGLVTRALEQLAEQRSGDQRARTLGQLADHHARRGDYVGELRARIRQLVLGALDDEAIAALRSLLARAGDWSRLRPLLTMRAEAATSPQARRVARLDLAHAAFQVGGGEASMREALAPWLNAAAEPEDVRAALGLVMHVHSGRPRAGIAVGEQLCRRLTGPAGAWAALWLSATAEAVLDDERMALSISASGARRHPEKAELLLQVERLALATGELDLAIAVYDALIDGAAGRHGRRALHYRAARMLERCGRPMEALERLSKAMSLVPGGGVIVAAMERVSRRCDDVRPVANAYLAVAQEAGHPTIQRHWLEKVTRMCASQQLSDPEMELKARVSLARVAADAPAASDDAVLKTLRQLPSHSHAQRQGVESVLALFGERASDAWNDSRRVEALLNSAEVLLDISNEPRRALDALSGIEVAAQPRELQLRALRWLAVAHAKLGDRPAQRAAAQEALALDPDAEDMRTLAEVDPVEGDGPTSETDVDVDLALAGLTADAPMGHSAEGRPPDPAAPASQNSTSQSSTSHDSISHDSISHDSTDAPEPTGAMVTSEDTQPERQEEAPQQETHVTTTMSDNLDDLRARAADGDPEALLALSEALEAHPDGLTESHYLYHRIMRAAPFRTDALRGLQRTAERLEAKAIAAVGGQLLSMFDVTQPSPRALVLEPELWSRAETAAFLRGGVPEDLWRLLAMAFEAARVLPGYHRGLERYDVNIHNRADNLPSEHGSIAERFESAARRLGREQTPLYLSSNPAPELRIVAELPGAVVASMGMAQVPGLDARLARAILAAQPEQQLVTALAPHQMEVILEGLRGAFGPSAAFSNMSEDGKAAAAALYDSVDKRDQAWLRTAVHELESWLTADKLRYVAGLAQVRGALLVTADPAQALATIVKPSELADEASFQHACRDQPLVAATVRESLGDEYLAAVAQSLPVP